MNALLSEHDDEDSNSSMSQEELDAYLAGEPSRGDDTTLTQEELDALLTSNAKPNAKDNPEDSAILSQKDLIYY